MKRIATAAVGVPLALAAVFWLPGPWFFVFVLAIIEMAVGEYVALARRLAPNGPHRVLLILVPIAALALTPALWPGGGAVTGVEVLWAGSLVLAIGIGSLVLLSRVPVDEGLISLGALAYGLPYLALPVASLYYLQQNDPWVLLLLLAVVWLGDTAAFFCGRSLGRHKMAPRVSPNKTWEGAAANVVAAAVAAAAWSYLRLGGIQTAVLLLAVVVSMAGQIGDLVESLIKRAAGVKDSGHLLPGHGGFLDRVDALLFAAPVMLTGMYLLGGGGWVP